MTRKVSRSGLQFVGKEERRNISMKSNCRDLLLIAIHPQPPSDMDTSSSESAVSLTIPKNTKVKYSVIDGSQVLSNGTVEHTLGLLDFCLR